MKRILGRDGGYPDFEALRDEMIAKHGVHGANTIAVLNEICPTYRLNCKEVDNRRALIAISEKRPVVARFRLTHSEWEIFSNFFQSNPSGILTIKVLDISRRPENEKLLGHAVVLTSFNSQCLMLMNSWGTTWADGGFFRIENYQVLGLEFIDVFWYERDLSSSKRIFYETHGTEVAQMVHRKLKALQSAVHQCQQESKVTEFTGTLSEAVCPKCKESFKAEEGNILALNIYLTSISR